MRSKILFSGILVLFLCLAGTSGVYAGDALPMGEFDRDTVVAASFLEGEAGISAYGQVSSVDLDLAKNAYKNIEYETEDYIIEKTEYKMRVITWFCCI